MADALTVLIDGRQGEAIVRDGQREADQKFVTLHVPVRGAPLVTVATSLGLERFTVAEASYPAMGDASTFREVAADTGDDPRVRR